MIQEFFHKVDAFSYKDFLQQTRLDNARTKNA